MTSSHDHSSAIHRMTASHKIYSVHLQCGVGEFLWVKDSTDEVLIGSNADSLMEIASDQDLMSDALFDQFREWAMAYMDGQPKKWADPWQLDFDRFNVRGLELTEMLYQELGRACGVQYVTAHVDPAGVKVLLFLPPA